MTNEVGASRQGRELIRAYQDAVERKSRAERELNAASCSKRNAINALAKWMLPADAKPGERFCVWDRDKHDVECLFEVTAPSHEAAEPQVALRYRK